MFLSKKTDS